MPIQLHFRWERWERDAFGGLVSYPFYWDSDRDPYVEEICPPDCECRKASDYDPSDD